MIDKLGEEEGLNAAKEAIREFGHFRGALVRKKVEEAGLPLTMENEYKFHDLPIGTNIWNAVSSEKDGKRVSEIITCPFGQVWKSMGVEEIGLTYCDIEYISCFQCKHNLLWRHLYNKRRWSKENNKNTTDNTKNIKGRS